MLLMQIPQSTRLTFLRVPVNTPADHSRTPALTTPGHLTPKSISSKEQIDSFQAFLNEVNIRLSEVLEYQESLQCNRRE